MSSTFEKNTRISSSEDFIINENSKVCIANLNGRTRGENFIPVKGKICSSNNVMSSGDSALKSFANNVMSLFGYGNSESNVEDFKSTNKESGHNKNKMRQRFSRIQRNFQKDRNESVAQDTDVEELNMEEFSGQTNIGNACKSFLESEEKAKNGESGVNGVTSENVSGPTNSVAENSRDRGNSASYLPIIAHINGKPVHAKHLVKSKNNKENYNVPGGSEHFQNGKFYSGFNQPLLVPSSMQYTQFAVPVKGYHNQVFYNTPFIKQRVIPQVKPTIYQPVYAHSQAESTNFVSANGSIGHVRQSTLYSQDNYSGLLVNPGKESLIIRSNGAINEYSRFSNVNDASNFTCLGFATPLVAYRNLSHVPNNKFVYKGNYHGSNTINDFESAKADKTRLQSSNGVVLDCLENFRDGNFASSNPVPASISNENRVGGVEDDKKKDSLECLDLKTSTKLEINDSKVKSGTDRQNHSKPSTVKDGSGGNPNALSLTTTTSSDNGSTIVGNGDHRDKLKKTQPKDINQTNNKASLNKEGMEKSTEKNCGIGFIPQASPVVNYRSTLDYLVTPLVRYRDISSNLKVRTVATQLSSIDSSKFKGPSNGASLGSDSSKNANILPSNECRETVYIPVAFPLLSQGTGSFVSNNCGSSTVLTGGPSSVGKNHQNENTKVLSMSNNKDMPSNISVNNIVPVINDCVSKKITINNRYSMMKPSLRPNIGNAKLNGLKNNNLVSGYKENSHAYEENVKNRNLKMYVNRMYQLLSDPSQFPPLPKEIAVSEIEFLMRPKVSGGSCDENNSTSGKGKDENIASTNNYKCCRLGEGMEWDSINKGTFCTVYKANHNSEIVAVKCPQRKIHDSDPLMSRYRCYIEWKLLYRCSRHPNILNLIGGIRISEYEIWLVTEYIKTGDLFKLIHGNGSRSRAFRDSVEYRFRVMYQLADSIRFLHSLSPKIVHKDLKSNNILVDENFNIRICDFGDAEELHYNVITCCTAVTWQYAPPEIVGCSDPARPNSNATEKVDVWSMGCIFLEILTKKTPLQHILDNIDDSCKHPTLYNMIHSNKIEHELKIPPLPESLYNLIIMCLRPNPEVRASSMEVFDYLVNNEKKILKQLAYVNQHKLGVK